MRRTVTGRIVLISPRIRWHRVVPLTIGGVLLLFLGAQLWAMAHNPHLPAGRGADYGMYMEAARRWLAGGPFYHPDHVAGPYFLDWGAVLYPPQALPLFAVFTVVPWPVWFAVPTAILGWTIAHHRPTLWGWVAIVGLLAWDPWAFIVYQSGTPTIWLVAALALATRWPWVAALVLLKPTLAPFAVIGILDRRWWLVALGLGILGLLMLPLTIEWIRVGLNARGPLATWTYSLVNAPVMLVPIVAWLSSGRAGGIGWRTRVAVALGRPRWMGNLEGPFPVYQAGPAALVTAGRRLLHLGPMEDARLPQDAT